MVYVHVERRTGLSRSTHPRLFRLASIGVPMVAFSSMYFVAIPFGAPNPVNIVHPASKSQIAAVGGLDCKQFNPSEWDRGQGQLNFDGSVWSVATGSPNGLLRFGERIPLDSNIEVTFVPASAKQVNFIITMHDIYELVVGDGSYQGITLKTAKGDNQKMKLTPTVDGKRRVIFQNGHMEPGADVKVVINQGVSRLENGSYELNLRIARTSFAETPSSIPTVYATYNFLLPPRFNYKDEMAWFSVGLKAASDRSLVAVEILCVDLGSAK